MNPPLLRLAAAAPAVSIGYDYDWETAGYYERPGARPIFPMAETFVASNGRHTLKLIRLARIACAPFSLLGAIICFLWARDLFGSLAGLIARALMFFHP